MKKIPEVPSHLQILISDFFGEDEFSNRNIGFAFLVYKSGYLNGFNNQLSDADKNEMVTMTIYNQLWKFVHRMESELLKRGASLHELDVIRKESFDEKKNEKGGE